MDAVFMLYKSFDSGALGQLYEVRVRN